MGDKHSRFGLPLLLMLIVLAVGCASKGALPATQAAAIDDLVIIYSSRARAEPLREAQRHAIDAVIADAAAKAGEPWFVYVHYNSDGHYGASAYFRPREAFRTVRRGLVVNAGDKASVMLQMGVTMPAPMPYVQVAQEGTDASAVPAEADLPFPPPEGISDDELVGLVKAARMAATKRDPTVAKMPVDEIKPGSDGIVEVFFMSGAVQQSKRGVVAAFRREGASFALYDVSHWSR